MREKILIVDDAPLNISIIAKQLETDYELKIATNGLDAIEIVRNHAIDLILLDIVMPKMNGYDVAKVLKKDPLTNQIPIIFITSKNDTQSVINGFTLGAVDYIAKPFSLEELSARVANHIKIKQLQDSLEASNQKLLAQNQALELSRQNVALLLENSYNGIALIDLETHFLFVNEAYAQTLGYSQEEMLHQKCTVWIHSEDIDAFRKNLEATRQQGKADLFHIRIHSQNRGIRHLTMAMALMPDKQKIVINISDVTELNRANRIIEHNAQILDHYVLLSKTDLQGRITDVSSAYAHFIGYTKEEMVGKNHNISRHEDTPSKLYKEMWDTITQDQTWQGEIKNRTKEGVEYWTDTTIAPDYDEEGRKVGYFGIRQIITSQKQIEILSITDELTGLYNRRYFNEIFKREFNRIKRAHKFLGLMIIDIDYFKQYNDTYGHQAGDSVLEKVGKALKASVKRSYEYSFRLGGEEFAIITSDDSNKRIMQLAHNIVDTIESLKIEHSKNSASDYLSISLGLVCTQIEESMSLDSLYKNADDLLYQAKQNGRNQVICNQKPFYKRKLKVKGKR